MKTLTLGETAEFLKVLPHQIQYLIEHGELPAAHLGGQWLILEDDLLDYLRSNYAHTPSSPIQVYPRHESQFERKPIRVLFKELVPNVLKNEESKVRRGEISRKLLEITNTRLKKWVMPIFGECPVDEIDYIFLEKFVGLLTDNELQGVAINQNLVIVKKVLTYAQLTNLIPSVPSFPRVKVTRSPRGGFTIAEYRKLLKTAWHLRDKPYPMQTGDKLMRMEGYHDQPLTMSKDLARMIGFMVNSFVRPSDIKLIQHKHVEIISNDYRYLRLTLPETKKHDRPIVTMPAAVSIYKRLLDDAKKQGFGRPNDYLFFPGVIKNREYALRQIEFLFNWVLTLSKLKVGAKGQNRTLYSLRHTAITFRLLYGQGVDVLTLARNARTSVEMVERFYASTLNGEMNVGLLHSKRSRKFFTSAYTD